VAISIDYSTTPFRIIVPQADLTLVGGTLYELDTDQFRKDLKALEAAETGIVFEDTHRHNTQVTIAGVTYARLIEILNSTNSPQTDEYEVFFSPDTTYSVRLAGSNNNVFDLQNGILANTVTQVIPQNSAGLIAIPKIDDLHGQLRRAIFVDNDALVNGNGYQQTPYNTWADAIDAAEAQNLQTIYIEADATLDRQIKNFELLGIDLPTIDLNGQIVDNSVFRELDITGVQGVGGSILALTCNLTNLQCVDGSFLRVTVIGTLTVEAGGNLFMNEVAPFLPGSPWTLDMGLTGAASSVAIHNHSGGVTVTNMDNASDVVHINSTSGVITLDATVSAGSIVLAGVGELVNNSTGTATVDSSALLDPTNLATTGGGGGNNNIGF
jgi:hypothetical protein